MSRPNKDNFIEKYIRVLGQTKECADYIYEHCSDSTVNDLNQAFNLQIKRGLAERG